jgi:hypothetical protein
VSYLRDSFKFWSTKIALFTAVSNGPWVLGLRQ